MVNPNRSANAATRSHNRIAAVMAHTSRYAFRGASGLVKDVGLDPETAVRLVRGTSNPLYITIARVVKCLERVLDRKFDLREIASIDGRYPTQSVCELVGCKGCLPDHVYNSDGSRIARYANVTPGHWSGDTAEFNDRIDVLVEELGQ